MGKIAKLNYLIEKTYQRVGNPETRKRRLLGLKRIAKDIVQMDHHFTRGWYGIQKTHLEKLISDWQKKGYADATIKNRLGLLRHFINLARLDIEIPDNKNGFFIKKEANQKDFPNCQKILTFLNSSDDFSIPKLILGFEYYFGLTKKEAMQIRQVIHYRDSVFMISNKVAFNGYSREIPIITTEQEKWVTWWKNHIPANRSLLEILPYPSLSVLYQVELRQHDLPSHLSYRRYYAGNRYHQLLNKNLNYRAVLKTLKQEMGLSSDQIRRYLRELQF